MTVESSLSKSYPGPEPAKYSAARAKIHEIIHFPSPGDYGTFMLLQPIQIQANPKGEEVRRMKTEMKAKKKVMSEQTRRKEARFWKMMRAAETGERFLMCKK